MFYKQRSTLMHSFLAVASLVFLNPGTPPSLFLVTAIRSGNENDNELGKAAALFSGPLEEVATRPDFSWLESPVWSDSGNYLLFSDVKWQDENNHTCGMIFKYDNAKDEVSEFLKCSGLVGPGETPSDIADYVEAGSNGLYWGWNGDGDDLLICQHGKSRIIRINVQDVNEQDASIDPTKVQVLVDEYNSKPLNSPNDMVIHEDVLYFTDPPFGNMRFSSGDDNQAKDAFANLDQDAIGVYTLTNPDDDSQPQQLTRLLNFGSPDPNAWYAPNGIAVTNEGALVIPITNFNDPHFDVFFNQAVTMEDAEQVNATAPSLRLESEYRIQGENADFPPLNDGITYSPELNVLFGSGPGGVYIYNATAPFGLLGFLRIDDLNANNVVGGGYLWITANQRLLRIPLATADDGDDDDDGDDATSPPTDDGSSTASARWMSPGLLLLTMILVAFA